MLDECAGWGEGAQSQGVREQRLYRACTLSIYQSLRLVSEKHQGDGGEEGTRMSTGSRLPALSFLRYCLRSRLSMCS
jgi:hypothetical protein